MSKLYDVMYPNGKYNDPETGQEKTRWMKCGMIVATQAGKVALKLDALPANPSPNQNGEGGLWLQCFEPNQPDGQRKPIVWRTEGTGDNHVKNKVASICRKKIKRGWKRGV